MSTVLKEHATVSVLELKHRATSRSVALIALLVTLGLVFCAGLGQSVMTLFWYDELVTLRIAGLHTLGMIFEFFNSGKDTTTFLPAMLVHLSMHLPIRPEVSVRLPFVLSYIVLCLCIWTFVNRRYSAGYAVAAVFLLAQGWTFYFATEARAYSFLLMGAAIAMVCWQSANTDRRSYGLAELGVFAGLAIALLFHFFAIFLFVPFVVAEIYYTRRSGKVRRGMWLAIVLSLAALAVTIPNVLAAHQVYGKSFWSKPSVGELTSALDDMLTAPAHDVIPLLMLIAGFFWFRSRRAATDNLSLLPGGFPRPEWLLLIGISLVPIVASIAGIFLGAYRAQYTLYAELGTLLLCIGGLAELFQRRRNFGWALAFLILIMWGAHDRDRIHQGIRVLERKPRTTGLPSEYEQDWVKPLRAVPGVIVADGPDTFFITDYYAPEFRNRMVLLTSHQRALQQPKSMTNELNMEVFGRVLGYNLQDYDSFVQQHRDFLVLASQQQFTWTWLLQGLVKESVTKHDVTVTPLWLTGPNNNEQIYRVHFSSPVS